MRVLIRGAGDIASGIAVRLHLAGFEIIMTDLPDPTSIRRTVCFSEAVRNGAAEVEGVRAVYVPAYQREEGGKVLPDAERIRREVAGVTAGGNIAVLADEEAECREYLAPDVLVDAVLAKKNLGTRITDAPVVIGVGPGFSAGTDCHAAVETARGHDLGRTLYRGSPMPDTGIPGNIGGYTVERVLRAPCAGVFRPLREIGDSVEKGESAAMVGEMPVICRISGVLRGILPEGTRVTEGMKCGDIDPRNVKEYCGFVSDKARAVGGGVLEAILHFSRPGRS